jgi:hypothetical protein
MAQAFQLKNIFIWQAEGAMLWKEISKYVNFILAKHCEVALSSNISYWEARTIDG